MTPSELAEAARAALGCDVVVVIAISKSGPPVPVGEYMTQPSTHQAGFAPAALDRNSIGCAVALPTHLRGVAEWVEEQLREGIPPGDMFALAMEPADGEAS